jgi:chloramphenicol-sensitive protein RarD
MANPLLPSPGRLSTSGILLAVACYVLWGIVPVYWKAIDSVPAHEMLIARVLWTLVLMIFILVLGGRRSEIAAQDARAWAWNLGAAALLALNWGVFIYAVQTDRVLATSLGYYINPLMSVLLGMLVLGERLSRIQTLSVAVATAGVVAMTIQAGELPWIALVLATSFAIYGLLHKMRPQPPLGGLVREMLVLSPAALATLAFLLVRDATTLAAASPATHFAVSLSGPITALPLLLFHASTKRLPLVVVGMFQYIAPTLTFLLATLYYDEPFTRDAAIGFALVWAGLGLFLFDATLRLRGIAPQ